MGKAAGVSRRRRKKYNYNRNVKKIHKKLLALPKIRCKQLKEAWDSSKTYHQNMQDMGLSDNPNKTIDSKKRKTKAAKSEVINDLEAEANAPRPKTLRIPTEPMKFCVYMIEKHGDDYVAMARDPKNYYQATPTQIKKKILKFKSIPVQWNSYLRAKGMLTEEMNSEEYDINLTEITNDVSESMESQ